MTESEPHTSERLLDAAECLFAEHGFAQTSLRAITQAAGANLAAVHYHFGSKEALTEAVLKRRLDPLNQERLRRLDALEAAADGSPLAVEPILEALFVPAIEHARRLGGNPPSFLRLLGQIYFSPDTLLQTIVKRQFSTVLHRFLASLHRALPDLPLDELFWRFHFAIGSLIHTVSLPEDFHDLTGGICDPRDVESVRDHLLRFLGAAFLAPAGTRTPAAPETDSPRPSVDLESLLSPTHQTREPERD